MTENEDGRVYHPGDDPDAEHVNPEMDKSLWDHLVWQAIRVALDMADKEPDVFRIVRLWNLQNDPQLPQKELDQKIIWSLRHFENKFRKH
jgi:hypothetical protein